VREEPGETALSDPWRDARTFEDLCDLGARFVEGSIDVFPGWGFPSLDRESDVIAPDLAALNRSGFLTLASQPAAIERQPDGVVRRRRAFVFGFVSDAVARRLEQRAGNDGEIEIRVFRRGRRHDDATPTAVGERDGEADAYAGYPAFAEELALFADACGADALAALARAPFASAVDLVWGRERALWDELARAVGDSRA
jgi:hypothetical protein